MSKQILGGIVALAAVLLIGGLFLMNNKSDTKTSPAPAASNTQSPTSQSDSKPAEQPAQPVADQSNQVEIKNFDFVQKKITIKKGTTVTWTNNDSAKHDITPDTESSDFKASELFGKGETYQFTFNKAGTYSYHCSPHPYMKATVEVVE